MLQLPHAIVVGATNRNCGKTSFVCQLLSRFAEFKPIAIKIKTVYPNDSKWHGSGSQMKGNFEFKQETRIDGREDSVRMLNAGASQVFYLKVLIDYLAEGLETLLKQIPPNCPLIFESNSFLEVGKPALFVLIKSADSEKYKPSAKKFMHEADILIDTDGENHSLSPSAILISWYNQQWNLI